MSEKKFNSYSFENTFKLEVNSVRCERPFPATVGYWMEVYLFDLNPDSLVQMIKEWDRDVINALIEEIK